FTKGFFQFVNISSDCIIVFFRLVNTGFYGFFFGVELNEFVIFDFVVIQQPLNFLISSSQFILRFFDPLSAALKRTLFERYFLFQPVYLIDMLMVLDVFLIVEIRLG